MEPQAPALERLKILLAQGPGGEADTLIRLLASRLRAVCDLRMRRAVLRAFVEETDDAALLAVLARLIAGAREGRDTHRDVLGEFALDGHLLTGLPYDRITDLYEIGHAAKLARVAGLFLGDRHRANPTATEAQHENEHLDRPSGVRRSLARGRDRYLLDRVLHDRDPGVIRNLLDNPRLVERDVVRVAAMRPTRPEILRSVADHPRWSARYAGRLALGCNPYTPVPIAIRLVSTLLKQDLGDLATSAALPGALLEAVRVELDGRSRLGDRPGTPER
jgi:hypothetical protein